jgi:glycosyltransferase involved in cell wall biosynthesis
MIPPTQAVVILLSTFNGQRYIDELLNSLYAQTHQPFSIVVRDDGSTDQTLAVIKKYTAKFSNIALIEGDNRGVVKSFMQLLQLCPIHPGQFYAFCDQDDVWQPYKLANALHHLKATPHPAHSLYCSRLEYTDSQLNHLGFSPIPTFFGFENALIENSAIGCTMVFGEAIRQKILSANPEHMMMHDWWAYLVATAFGDVIFDPEASILYRQHANNVVGWDKRLPKLLKKSSGFLHNILSNKQGLQALKQAKHFLNTYPELGQEKQQTIHTLLQLRNSGTVIDRCHFLNRTKIQRNNTLENLILKLTILCKLH